MYRYKEHTELNKYEYHLLSTTLDLLSKMNDPEYGSRKDALRAELKDLLNKTYTDIRFFKLSSSQIIIEALRKGYYNKDFSDEALKIVNRINKLKR